jgi:hypothetical protein
MASWTTIHRCKKENGMTGQELHESGFEIREVQIPGRVQSQIEDAHGRTHINNTSKRYGSSNKFYLLVLLLIKDPVFLERQRR